MIHDRVILTWPTNRKSYGLSNGAIFNNTEQHLTHIGSRHYLTLNISETVRDIYSYNELPAGT